MQILALVVDSLVAADLLVALQAGLLQVVIEVAEQLQLVELLMGVDLLPLKLLEHLQAVVLLAVQQRLLVLNGNRLLQSS